MIRHCVSLGVNVCFFVLQLNIVCMISCCWCTTSKCYQDKDAVEYYVGGGARVSQDFDARRKINGSDTHSNEGAFR